MVLETIYIVRHGHRMGWVVDPTTGIYSSTAPTPTGIPADPQLASYGVTQAEQLATKVAQLDPLPDAIYSSPFYRCLQTISPAYKKLHATGRLLKKVRVDNGIGEFFGKARFQHPAPASLEELQTHFDFLDAAHKPSIRPPRTGETLEAIHDRLAYAMKSIVDALDRDPQQPRAVILCTHAASMICIGRVLTGRMPSDIDSDDFRCGTCALSRFERRRNTHNAEADVPQHSWDETRPENGPVAPWKNGKGIAGGWECVVNGDCSFLEGGEERSWHFTGDESFVFDEEDDSNDKERGTTCSKTDGAKL